MPDKGVDFHMQVPVVPDPAESFDNRKRRLARALAMAANASDRNDWETYDEWITLAGEYRKLLGG